MQRSTTQDLIQRILGNERIELQVVQYRLSEELDASGRCRVQATLRPQSGAPSDVQIDGEGVGLVDAAFHALMNHYADEFESLKTLTFTGFEVQGKMETGSAHGLDANALVGLTVHNDAGQPFHFEVEGRSTVACALKVVVQAASYFINSEKAFVRMYAALTDARTRNRADLVQTYTAQLAELVHTTSYSEVIQRIRRAAL